MSVSLWLYSMQDKKAEKDTSERNRYIDAGEVNPLRWRITGWELNSQSSTADINHTAFTQN